MKPNYTGDVDGWWPQVCRSPQVIAGFILAYLTPVSVGLALGLAANTIALGIGYAVTAGLLIGANSLLKKFLSPSGSSSSSSAATPSPTDVQTNIRQDISARRRVYGRMLVGSVIVFGFRRGEKSYILHYLCEGPIHGFVSFRLDKKPVSLDSSGFVTDAQYQVGGRSRVQILTLRGLDSDGTFASLIAAFPELNTPLTPFRWKGCAMALQIVEQVPAENLQDVYPNNLPTLQFLIDGADDVYDPRTSTSGFTNNAACCLLSEIMDVYGLTSADTDEIDFAAFASFADHCDEAVALKAGGTEKRYRCAGVITLDAENEARITAIMSVCNADVYIDRKGRMSVRRKMRDDPSIALRARNGDHFSVQMEGGRAIQKLYNAAKVTYVDPQLNYKQNEIIWRDATLVDEDGAEFTTAISATLCPSPTQAQRLAKLAVYEANPAFSGQLTSGPQALELLDDYVFTLDLTPEDDFEHVAVASDAIEYDANAMTVTASFTIFRDGANAWNAAVDEQFTLVLPLDLPSYVDDVALNVVVTVEIGENSTPYLKFAWSAAGGATLPDSYTQQVQVSAADAEEWSNATVTQSSHTAIFSAVSDGGAYDWRIRNIASGSTFDYQNSTSPVTVTVDATAPVALLSFGGSNGTGQFSALFSTDNDSHLSTVAIYKVASGGAFSSAVEVGRYAVAPGIGYSLPITSATGNFDIYARPFNKSNIAGPLSGPAAVTVS